MPAGRWIHGVLALLAGVIGVLAFYASVSSRSSATGPLLQRGYLWQRTWNTGVIDAAFEGDRSLDGLIILGGEMVWDGVLPRVKTAAVDWSAVARLRKPVSLALRVAPFAGSLNVSDAPIKGVIAGARNLLAEASSRGIAVAELQLDFDCAQKKLAGYRVWLRTLRTALPGVRLVITTLPAWLEEGEFAKLIREVDGYVLQVHSVPLVGNGTALCDPQMARRWVAQAASLHVPFSVALPTYRCLAGYDAHGRLLGVLMDGISPSWPPGTRVLEFRSDAAALASLVREWRVSRLAELRELVWYRLPSAGDARNWRWPTLRAVMEGRAPLPQMVVRQTGTNPVDLFLENIGEADGTLDRSVAVSWVGGRLAASDAQPDWTLRLEKKRAIFTPAKRDLTLSPGSRRPIGWLRYDPSPPTQIAVEMVR